MMERIVVNDVLAFLATKINKAPKTEITEWLKFFEKEEIGKAKELMYEECKKMGAKEKGLKYEERKNSVRRGAKEMEIEDVYDYMVWLQGQVEDEEMPRFVSDNIDNMPNNRREEWVELEEEKEVMKRIEENINLEEEKNCEARGQIEEKIDGVNEKLKYIIQEMERKEMEDMRRLEGEKWKTLEIDGRFNKVERLIERLMNKEGLREERREERQG